MLKSVCTPSGEQKYRLRAWKTLSAGAKWFLVDFPDIASFDADIAAQIINKPDEMLQPLKEAAYDVLYTENPVYANQVQHDLRVRIAGVDNRVPLRSLGKEWLNKLISISGTIVRASNIEAKMVKAVFVCENNHIQTADVGGEEEDELVHRPGKCEVCETPRVRLDPRQSEFVDYQVMRIQEPPEELPPGQIPAYFDVTFTGDLVNIVRPGDRVVITGILRAVSGSFRKSKVYSYKVECNYAETLGKEPELLLSKEDEEKIRGIVASSHSPDDVYRRLINSVAPTILGHEKEKEAMLLLLAGAPGHRTPDGTRLRGEINVLFVGDPGISKSMLLKFAAGIAPRGIYTSGRGSSAAGLSAAVVKEKDSFTLEIGATVLGDQGVTCVDELDKLRPEDRSALHEVMEQGTVTISKAGINATLNARTSLLAAMNPIAGLYNPYNSFSENVNLPPALLSRFDLIFIMRDAVAEEEDRKLARHVITLRDKGDYPVAPPVDPQTLKKYLMLCKRINPRISEAVKSKLEEFYVILRRHASAEGGISATPRTLDSLIRLSQARARLLMREEVQEDDAQAAISLMEHMFSQVLIDPKTGKKLDFGQIMGAPAREMSIIETIIRVIKILSGDEKKPVEKKAIISEVLKTGKFTEEEVEKKFSQLFKEGKLFEPEPGYFKLV